MCANIPHQDDSVTKGRTSDREAELNVEGLKGLARSEVENRSRQLKELSLKIHANPEIGLQEVKAAAWLSEYLEQNGFTLERGICELPTAFRASYGKGKPVIGLVAEYDALPNLGHACGHNIISAIAVGAGLASRPIVDKLGGSIQVIGTPAEESYGGKVAMAARGAFDNLDFAMMVHPGWEDRVIHYTFANQALKVEFFGKASHASAQPELGINALEAMLQSFNHINSLRQHIVEKARIHGIITNGGEAANIVPAYTSADFMIRAADNAYLEELKKKVLNCFVGAATATGARLEYSWVNEPRASMRNNFALAQLFTQNLESLGRKVRIPSPTELGGSADLANVSLLVPTIHPWIAISSGIMNHQPEFTAIAASEAGMRGLIDGAKAMAMTVVDLLSYPDVRARIKEEFQARR